MDLSEKKILGKKLAHPVRGNAQVSISSLHLDSVFSKSEKWLFTLPKPALGEPTATKTVQIWKIWSFPIQQIYCRSGPMIRPKDVFTMCENISFGMGWLSLPVAFTLLSVPATHGFPAKACSRIFLCSVKSSPLALFPLVILSLLFMEFACVREN